MNKDTAVKAAGTDAAFATAQATLLAPHALDHQALEQVFGQLLAHKVDYADLYFQYSRSEGWSLEEGIVKSGSFNIDQGVGVRAVAGEKTAFAYSDDISLPRWKSAAQATRAIARQRRQAPARRSRARRGGHDLYRAARSAGEPRRRGEGGAAGTTRTQGARARSARDAGDGAVSPANTK